MPNDFPIIKAITFTPIYSPLEDRIRLIVNYADYVNRCDLWLTRAFLLKLIPVIEDTLDTHELEDTDVHLRTEIEQKAQSKTDSATMIITEKEGELVVSVDITYRAATQEYEIVFKTDTQWAVAVLSGPLLRTLLKSIFAAIPKIDWGISPQWIL